MCLVRFALPFAGMKWLLLDGFNLTFRAFYALPELTRPDGFPTGALHGWSRLQRSLVEREKPDRVVAFFDLEGSTRHLEIHPEYKANRAETPEPLKRQIPEVKRLASLMGACVVARPGVEADDLIASFSARRAAAGDEVVIVSADKDFGQCVGGRVVQLAPSNNPKDPWVRLDAAGIEAKFGVPPERVTDYLALMGDSVDNIPGIKGVGPKTAAKWIAEYGDIEGVLAAAPRIEPVRFRELLAGSAELLRKNRTLVTFRTDYPTDEADAPAALDFAGLCAFYEAMGMHAARKDLEKHRQVELF